MKVPTEKLKQLAKTVFRIPRVKITTLILCAICGYGSYEAGHKVGSLEARIPQSKPVRAAYNGYDTEGLANTANAYQFVDIPPKPTTEGVD